MPVKDRSDRSADNASAVALICLIPVFLFVIASGWHGIAESMVHLPGPPAVTTAGVWVLSLFIAITGVAIAKAVASEHRRVARNRDADLRYTWIAYFAVLFGISAVGTMNFLFEMAESDAIVSEISEATRERLVELSNAIETGVTTAEYDAEIDRAEAEAEVLDRLVTTFGNDLVALRTSTLEGLSAGAVSIDGLFEDFKREVTNPMRAGCGEAAQSILGEIRVQLPTLALPTGGCGSSPAETMLLAYGIAIDAAKAREFDQAGATCRLTAPMQEALAAISAAVPAVARGDALPCAAVDARLQEIRGQVAAQADADVPEISAEEQRKVDFRRDSLAEIGAQLDNIAATFGGADVATREAAVPVLKEAWRSYSTILGRARSMVDAAAIEGLPSSIEDDRLEKLGNITNTLEMLLRSLDRVSTYVIIATGLLFDILLVAFFNRHLSSSEARTREDVFTFPGMAVGTAPNLLDS